MNAFVKLFLLCLVPAFAMAQKDHTWGYVTNQQADSLRRSVITESNDTLKMAAFRSLGFYYQDFIPDSGLYFHKQQLALSKKLNMKLWQADAYSQSGYVLNLSDDYMKSYEYHSEAMKLASDEKNESDNWRSWTFSNAKNSHEARISILGMNYQMMGNLWGALGDREKQRSYYEEAIKLGETINNGKIIYLGYTSLANVLTPDSAIMITNKGLNFATAAGYSRTGNSLITIAGAYANKGLWDSAFVLARKSLAINLSANYTRALVTSYQAVSRLYGRLSNKDSSLFYAEKTLATALITGLPGPLLTAYQTLSIANQLNNKIDIAFKYEQLSNKLNDSLKNARIASLTKYQKFYLNEQQRLKKLDEEKTAYQNNVKIVSLTVVLVAILMTALILYRNNKQKQKANKVLEETLANLKSTQSQLIQSEKMASLGELTAGIAHEIQNPLNFVNNFSDLNNELINELKEEIVNKNYEEVIAIADDIQSNEIKINHHGKRAESIVTGMLQHTRASSGERDPTDINKLADEYLRLSYHGIRAKDKNFNCETITDFDASIGKVNLMSQDIGRVILNLVNNAFYAVNEKKKLCDSELAEQGIAEKKPGEYYKPTITVVTKKLATVIEISVRDNGNGIPQKIVEKIFNPFFTTKPTGQGTGLGLSLSYDIVKAHGGDIKVETLAGEGSIFIIQLPIERS